MALRVASFLRTTALAAIGVGLVACTASTEATERRDDEVASVPLTEVERQMIGGVWLHAFTSWAETLHERAAPGEPLALTPAYLAYWHWFDQITSTSSPRLASGGNWQLASSLARRYGLAPAEAFGVATRDAGDVLRDARATLEASLDHGPLRDPARRRDRRVVRAELDRAFRVDDATRATLDEVFGPDVARTFTSTPVADPSGTPLRRADQIPVAYPGGARAASGDQTLARAIAEWRAVHYVPGDAALLTRVRRAIDDGAPVLLTWFVDFGALETRDLPARGSFNLATLRELGPQTQGGHVALLRSYAARREDGVVVSMRMPSEWGVARPEPAVAPGMPEELDLELDYLTTPIARCIARDGVTDTTSCPFTEVPLESVVLPPG